MRLFVSRSVILAVTICILFLLFFQPRYNFTQVTHNDKDFVSPISTPEPTENTLTLTTHGVAIGDQSLSPVDSGKEPSQWPLVVEKVVVMARLDSENTSWVSEYLPDWQPAIYSVETPSPPYVVPMNKGKEAMAYLTYIIDHYDALPTFIAFIHSHRDGYPKAWHTDASEHSNVVSLRRLRLNHVREAGYANLRCNWVPGCPEDVQPFRKPAQNDQEEHMRAAWPALFGKDIEVPRTIAAACCSQFAVTGEQVRKRKREEYVRYRDWLLETELKDETSGRIFEFLWHIIMGREAVHCPSLFECYSDTYKAFD